MSRFSTSKSGAWSLRPLDTARDAAPSAASVLPTPARAVRGRAAAARAGAGDGWVFSEPRRESCLSGGSSAAATAAAAPGAGM